MTQPPEDTRTQPPEDTRTHARGTIAIRSAADERVAHIKGLMARGEWFTRASALALSEEWGCALSTIKNYAAEASRALRQATDDEEIAEIKAATITRLERLSAHAEERGELRTAVRAEETKAKVAGLIAGDARNAPVVVVLGVKVPVLEAGKTLEHVVALIAEAPGTMTLDELRPRLAQALAGEGGVEP